MPQHTLQPKERIRLQKMLLVGLPEMYVPTHADVKYQYLGVRKVDVRETVFFDLNAELRLRRGDDNQIIGRLSGSLDVLLETGEVLIGNGFMNVDYDLPGAKGLRMVGTLSVNVRPAPPQASANKTAEKAAKSGEKGSNSAEGDSKSEEKDAPPSKDKDSKPEKKSTNAEE